MVYIKDPCCIKRDLRSRHSCSHTDLNKGWTTAIEPDEGWTHPSKGRPLNRRGGSTSITITLSSDRCLPEISPLMRQHYTGRGPLIKLYTTNYSRVSEQMCVISSQPLKKGSLRSLLHHLPKRDALKDVWMQPNNIVQPIFRSWGQKQKYILKKPNHLTAQLLLRERNRHWSGSHLEEHFRKWGHNGGPHPHSSPLLQNLPDQEVQVNTGLLDLLTPKCSDWSSGRGGEGVGKVWCLSPRISRWVRA